MDEKELYQKLGILTKRKEEWKENIDYVSSLLENGSPKIIAKALWMLGEMGLIYPREIEKHIEIIASFLDSQHALLRERSLNAIGRIGRAEFEIIKPYWAKLFELATDNDKKVRLSFIWANENIATNTPEIYKDHIFVFSELLDDEDNKVRMEAPEMFRVLGKRRPEFVREYIGKLEYLAEHDTEAVVRIHAKGAIKAILQGDDL